MPTKYSLTVLKLYEQSVELPYKKASTDIFLRKNVIVG